MKYLFCALELRLHFICRLNFYIQLNINYCNCNDKAELVAISRRRRFKIFDCYQVHRMRVHSSLCIETKLIRKPNLIRCGRFNNAEKQRLFAFARKLSRLIVLTEYDPIRTSDNFSDGLSYINMYVIYPCTDIQGRA